MPDLEMMSEEEIEKLEIKEADEERKTDQYIEDSAFGLI